MAKLIHGKQQTSKKDEIKLKPTQIHISSIVLKHIRIDILYL